MDKMDERTIIEKLSIMQLKLKVPKTRSVKIRTKNGGLLTYNYRSCEDILNALKPLEEEVGAAVKLSDKIVCVGNINYVEATATLIDNKTKDSVSSVASAKEPTGKNNMDEAQVTGSTSSYARKYALCGLFAIDDSQDIDAMQEYVTDHNDKTSESASKQSKSSGSYNNDGNTNVITKAQAQRMYKLSGFDEELCKKAMAKKGYAKSEDIKRCDYEAICDDVVKLRENRE